MLSMAQLAVFETRRYTEEVKAHLRDDEAWAVLMCPELRERTRATLVHMIQSIDEQIARIGTDDQAWLRSITGLRRFTQARLDSMPEIPSQPRSNNKETGAWKAWAAHLAARIDEYDPAALDELKPPYGALTAREWLENRRK